MSNIRHPKHPSSDVGFSTFDQPSVECRIFDIRNTLLRMFWIKNIYADIAVFVIGGTPKISETLLPNALKELKKNFFIFHRIFYNLSKLFLYYIFSSFYQKYIRILKKLAKTVWRWKCALFLQIHYFYNLFWSQFFFFLFKLGLSY